MFPFWFKWNGLIFIKTPVTAGDQGQGGGGQRSQVIMREIAGDLRAKHPVAPWVLVGKVPGGTRRPPKLPWWRQLRAGGLHREAERKQGATSPILEKKKRDGLRKPLPIVLLPSLELVSTVWARGTCASVFTRPLPARPLTLACLDRLFQIPLC